MNITTATAQNGTIHLDDHTLLVNYPDPGPHHPVIRQNRSFSNRLLPRVKPLSDLTLNIHIPPLKTPARARSTRLSQQRQGTYPVPYHCFRGRQGGPVVHLRRCNLFDTVGFGSRGLYADEELGKIAWVLCPFLI